MHRFFLLALAPLALLLVACGGGSSTSGAVSSAPVTNEVAKDAVPAAPEAPLAVVAPVEAPATEPPKKERKVVVLDPGHGGDEIGAARNGVVEKESNLDFALRVEKLLLANGVDVYLTRREDARAAAQVSGYTATRTDLQARLDAANAARGDIFLSIHSNGSEDLGQNGVEAWYDSTRAYAAEGKSLASMTVSSVLRELDAYGYRAQNRGLFDGSCFRQREGRCFTLFVIAGPRETTREEVMRRGGDPAQLGFGDQPVIYSRPADMPAALIELLIITNARDAAVLRDEAGRQAIARGVARAILEFLGLSFTPA